MHNRSSQNACLQWFFSGYTHLFCREYNQCVWIIVCMHKVKEGLYNSYITEWDILCDKVDICKHSSSISMLLLVLIYAYCFPTTRTLLTLATLHNMLHRPLLHWLVWSHIALRESETITWLTDSPLVRCCSSSLFLRFPFLISHFPFLLLEWPAIGRPRPRPGNEAK